MAGRAASSPPPPPPALLLLGPASSGRSALLFRAALAAASSSSSSPGRVLFLAPRPLQRLPGRGAAAAAEAAAGALQRIQFWYPASLRELLQLLASLHETWPGSPPLMVLDGLEEYLAGCPGPHTAAQLVALLLDTANHFSRKGGVEAEPTSCRLMVSVRLPGEGGDGAEQQLSAVRRYFQAQCWLHPETQESGSLDDGRGATKQVRARLCQPGTEDQEWLLGFEPQEEMTVSSLPCPREGGGSAGSQRPPASATRRILGLWWA